MYLPEELEHDRRPLSKVLSTASPRRYTVRTARKGQQTFMGEGGGGSRGRKGVIRVKGWKKGWKGVIDARKEKMKGEREKKRG